MHKQRGTAKAPAQATGRGKAPSKAPAKASSKAPAKAPAKAPVKAPAKAAGKTRVKAAAQPKGKALNPNADLIVDVPNEGRRGTPRTPPARMLRTSVKISAAGRKQACYAPGEVPILEVIRGKLQELRMSQNELSHAMTLALGAPLSRAAVGRWIRREAIPNMRQQVALANLWGLTMDQLHGRNVAKSLMASLDEEVLQQVDEAMLNTVQRSCQPHMRIITYATIHTQFFTVRPELIVDTDDGPLLSLFIMQGGAVDLAKVLGVAYALRTSQRHSTMYVAWINHGPTVPDFSPLKRLGLIGDAEVVPAGEVAELSRRGLVFAQLRAELQKVLTQ